MCSRGEQQGSGSQASVGTASSKASAPKAKPHKAEISSYALTPYTPDQYPKTFAKFGSRMDELEAYRRKAAETAARNPQCKQVDGSELSSIKAPSTTCSSSLTAIWIQR